MYTDYCSGFLETFAEIEGFIFNAHIYWKISSEFRQKSVRDLVPGIKNGVLRYDFKYD